MSAAAALLLLAAQAPPPTGIGAEGACLRQAMRQFPEFAAWFAANRERVLAGMGISPEPALPGVPAIGIPMEFRLPNGTGFVAEFPAEVRAANPAIDLACIGDMGRHRITALHFNNVIRRPQPGEVWSF
ncbi:MAG TPA: hypothetical protein VGW40_08535 [Allosphingosinicella sp.]|nr:hypothetical protein [Allosphingosinicella sp.]